MKKQKQSLTLAVLLSCATMLMPLYAQAQDFKDNNQEYDPDHKTNYWEVSIPAADGDKKPFAIFDVYDKTNDPEGYDEDGEHHSYRDFVPGEKAALTDSLKYISDMLGFAQKENLPLIELKLRSEEDNNASAGSSVAVYKDNEGKLTSYIAGTELAEAIQAKDKVTFIPEDDYYAAVEIDNADKGENWYFDKFTILPENGTDSDYYGTVTHEMFHALGLIADVHNENSQDKPPNIRMGSLVNIEKEGTMMSYRVFSKYEIGLRDVFGRVGYYYYDKNEPTGQKEKYADDNPLSPDDGATLPDGVSLESREIVGITLDEYNNLKNGSEKIDPKKFYVLRDAEKPEPDSGDDSDSNADKIKDMSVTDVAQDGSIGTQGGAYFTGKNVQEVLTTDGEVAEIAPADGVHNVLVKGGIPVNGYEDSVKPDLSHIELQNSLMSHQNYRNWCTFMEAELALLQDLGYDIDRSKYFGKSIYNSGTSNDKFNVLNKIGFDSTQRQGIGLHVYGSYVDVTQDVPINAAGDYSMGIRVDGVGNEVMINKYVSANGEGGNALAVAYGKEHNVTLAKDAALVAMGKDGVAARFDFGSNELGNKAEYRGSYIDARYIPEEIAEEYKLKPGWQMKEDMPDAVKGELVTNFDVSGTLAGKQAAIYISPNALVKRINIMDGAAITGNIISKWNPETIGYQDEDGNEIAPKLKEYEDGITELSFGVKRDANDAEPFADPAFKMDYKGLIQGEKGLAVIVAGGELSFTGAADVESFTIAKAATLNSEAYYKVAKGFNNNGNFKLSQKLMGTTINGDYTQSKDGNLIAGFNGQNESDTLEVSGTADLAGKITLAPVAGYYGGDTTIKVVDAKDYAIGSIDTVEIASANASPILKFAVTAQDDKTNYTITASRAADAYAQCAKDPLSLGIANALDKNAGSVQGDAQSLVGAIDFAGDSRAINAAMKQLNPAIYNSSAQATLSTHTMLNNLDFLGSFSAHERPEALRAGGGRGPALAAQVEPKRNSWRNIVMPFTSYTDQHNGSRSYTNHNSGALGAMERTLDNGLTLGYHAAVNHQSTSEAGSRIKGEGLYLGTQASYAPSEWNGWSLFGSARLGLEQMRSHRRVNIGSYSGNADADWTGFSGSFRLGTALAKETGVIKSGPFAAVDYSFAHRPGVDEDGAAIRTHLDGATYDSLRTQLGYQLTTLPKRLDSYDGTEWQAHFSAAWNHELLNNNGSTSYTLTDLPGVSISDTAANYGRDSLSLLAGVTFRTPKNLDVTLNLGSDIYRKGGSAVYGKVGLEWKF